MAAVSRFQRSARLWLCALTVAHLLLAACTRPTTGPTDRPADSPPDYGVLPTATPPARPGEPLLPPTRVPATPTPDAPATVEPGADRALESLVLEVLGEDAPSYGVVARLLAGGASLAINPDRVFYAASLFKLAIMYEAFRQRELGQLDFDERLTLTGADAAEDLGTLAGTGLRVGDRVSVRQLLALMITISDNSSAVMLLRRLGGASVDRGLRDLGLVATSVRTSDLPTTAADVARLLEAIARGEAVSPEASDEMAALLRGQTVRDRIPAGLPPEVEVGNKTGDWANATHDAAIVYAPFGAYVLVVLSEFAGDAATIVEVSRRVYEFYASQVATEPRPSGPYPY